MEKKSDFVSITFMLCSLIMFFPWQVLAVGDMARRVIDKTKYIDQYYEVDKDNNFSTHIYLGGQKIATIDDENELFYLDDHLGSYSIITNQEGDVVEMNDYDDYGKIISSDSNIDNDYKFLGKEMDQETALQYFHNRYYDTRIARFASIDPLLISGTESFLSDPQQLNSYAYGRNNPIRFIDPDGRANIEFQPYLPSSGINYNPSEPLGSYRELTIRSRGDQSIDTTPHQCVDLAKNFAKEQYGVSLDWTGHAYAYGNQSALDSSFSINNPNNPGRYVAYDNGGGAMPQENDIISWTGGQQGYGHVGFISEVTFDDASGEGYIYSVEQNQLRNRAIFYQRFARSYDNNGNPMYNVEGRNGYSVQGWARYENQSSLSSPSNYTSSPYTPATQSPIEH